MKRRQQGILTGMPFMANIAPRTFVDDLGRKLYLAKAPTRIVSLAPSVTEMLFALGAGEHIVAVTEFCDYPAEARLKPKIGGLKLSLEAIIAAQPDLVLVPHAFLDPTVLAKLDELKISTYVLQAKTLEDILTQLNTLGRILNRSTAATDLVAGLRQRIRAVREQTQNLTRPKVFYVLNGNPLMTVGPGSFIHQMLDAAGGANIAATAAQAYPRISLEEVLAQNPDILMFPVGAAEGIPESEQAQWLRWPQLSAVRQHRLYRIDSELVDRPGPRIVDGLEQLAKHIHPEVFRSSSRTGTP
ncbi:MAG: cobalamin-binding protein [Nitrospiraceae bacterium]|nr:cobalamin-binding protein [Nitrospiraceae bacterium]